MDDASGHGGHDGHGAKAEPATDLGRAMRDVLAAAPQFVATLQAKPDDHGHGHDDHKKPTSLDPELDGLIQEINEGIEKNRSPAGVIAASCEARDRILAAFAGMDEEAGKSKPAAKSGSGVLAGAALGALALVAGAFLIFGGHADVAYPAGSDPDYRSVAFAGAVDTPNLAWWLAWIVLIVAAAGGIAWLMSQVSVAGPQPRQPKDEPADLKKAYEKGGISRHLYNRGQMLMAERARPEFRPTIEAAREHSTYVLALADELRRRRDLDAIRPNRPVINLGQPGRPAGL